LARSLFHKPYRFQYNNNKNHDYDDDNDDKNNNDFGYSNNEDIDFSIKYISTIIIILHTLSEEQYQLILI